MGEEEKQRITKDDKLLNRALREGWAVPNKLKRKAIKRMSNLLSKDNLSARDQCSAVKCLLNMDELQLKKDLVEGIAEDKEITIVFKNEN